MSLPDADFNRWFAEEVQLHEPALRAYLTARYPTLRDHDDLVQESYIRLMKAHASRGVRNAKAYLFAMARNAACDLFRRSKVISFGALEEIDRAAVLRDETAQCAELEHELELLAGAIRSLPERCRRIVELRKLEGLSYEAIARQLAISESTVNAQLAIGTIRIRDYLRVKGALRGRRHATSS